MTKKSSKSKKIFSCLLFVLGFLCIFTALSLVYLPKFAYSEAAAEMPGFYEEEQNSIDVLVLGSCNMYSSYSAVLAYEEYGLTSYGMCCSDQEIFTAYHYLIDALKTQDIKTVVLESLFLTCGANSHREYYDRLAYDHMPVSVNKLKALAITSSEESKFMKTIDSSAPNCFNTYASYLFPLLRYHSRDDISKSDISYYVYHDNYSKLKGGVPLMDYLRNDNLDFDEINNGSKIKDLSREYFIKIKELCEEKGINFVLVKSPNHYRWNDDVKKVIHDFADEMDVALVDLSEEPYEFDLYDYSSTTGRLNIYGMKKVSHYIGEYLVENCGVTKKALSEANKKKWDDCVTAMYQNAANNGMNITEGQISRICNYADGACVMWNAAQDSTSYSLYRSNAESEQNEYEKIAQVSDNMYLDTDVLPCEKYTYYVVPDDGSLSGTASDSIKNIYVPAISGFKFDKSGGQTVLNWDECPNVCYQIDERPWGTLNFNELAQPEENSYTLDESKSESKSYYWVRAYIEDGEDCYYGAPSTIMNEPEQ